MGDQQDGEGSDSSTKRYVLTEPAGPGDDPLQRLLRSTRKMHGTEPYLLIDGGVLTITSRFPYKQLTDPSQFRLLKLYPRSAKHPLEAIIGKKEVIGKLHGQLIEDAKLSDSTPYDCLSYTWGTGSRMQSIWLNDFRVAITDNLYRALRCLQREDEDRLVWVDFVCVNQDDLEERKRQVAIMYQIYENACEVVVDLGFEQDGSETLPELFQMIWDNAVVDKGKEETEDLAKTMASLSISDRLPSADSDVWVSFRAFLARPWFSRVWIVQEAIAARSLGIMCGSWRMNGSVLFVILGLARQLRLPGNPVYREGEAQWENEAAIGSRGILLMQHLLVYRKENSLILLKEESAREWSLLELLERSRHARASDPRDKVFAFLNLCKERNEVEADYTETVTESYIRLAKFFVQKCQISRLLGNAFMSDSSKLDLPSWVPDWSLSDIPFENIAPEPTHEQNEKEWPCAGGNDPGDISIDPSCNGLRVRVYEIDRIVRLGRIHSYRNSPPPCDAQDDQASESKVEDGSSLSSAKDSAKESVISEPPGKVDTVQETSVSADEAAAEAEWQQWPVEWRIFGELAYSIFTSPSYGPDPDTDVLWRTAVCERDVGTVRRATDEYAQYAEDYQQMCSMLYETGGRDKQVDRFMREFEASEELQAYVQSDPTGGHFTKLYSLYLHQKDEGFRIFSRAIRRLCFQLRDAYGEKQLVGRVPHHAQRGDFVVVIKGVSVPMVVRAVADGEHTDRFKLVGQAYYHGFMDGEMIVHPQPEFEEITIV